MNKDLRVNEASSPRHYEKIGHFVVRFEQAIEIMRICILVILEQQGLKNESLAIAVTARIGAYDILDILRSAIAVYLGDNPDPHLSKVSQELFKRTQELLVRRNQFLHSLWLDREPSYDAANLGYSFSNTKEGVKLKWLPTLAELDTDIEKASSTLNMLCALNGIIGGVAPPTLRQAFKFDADKKLRFDVEFAKSTGFKDLVD